MPTPSVGWPIGTSVTSRLVRARDWSSTTLGPCEKWPQTLRSAVDLVLSCHFPMVVLWGPELIQLYNDGYLALMGAKHPAGLGQPNRECWPEVWHINEPLYARVWQGETLTFEDQLYPIMRLGFLEDAFFTLCFSPLRDQAQTIVGVVVTVFETTRRIQSAKVQRRTEEALRQSEERLRAAQDAAQMASWEWNLETGNLLWSGSVERVYGRLPEAVTPVSRILGYLHPEDRDTVAEDVRSAIDKGNEFDHEFRVFWPDGSLHWIAGRGRTVPSPDSRSVRMIGIHWNITARKAAEEKLQMERIRLVDLFQQAPAFIAVVRGPKHIFEMTNRPYRELVGNRDLIGKSVVEALPEAQEQGFVALLDRVYETGEAHVAQASLISLVRTPGELPEQRYLDYVYQPMREVDGSTSGVIALGVDVTEKRRAEEALMQSEKLAAIGRLASSIAHEINNPLESVTNLLYLARGSTHLSEAKGYLDTAERELRRVSTITNQTLRFYKQSTDPTAVLSERLIAETVAMYQGRILNSRIQVQMRIRGSQPVICFEGEIRQVLSNLVGNAIDAMHPKGGSLLLRSRDGTHWTTGRRGVMITVADTGAGIARPVIKKIFDAFFSTKGARGNGLGLWISCEIVDRHHGSLRVYSSQRKGRSGTVFTVFLPFETVSRELEAKLRR